MAATNQELYDAIQDAILALASGECTSFNVDGTSYTVSNLTELMNMRDNIKKDLSRSSGRRPFIKRVKFGGGY